jgi:hypothetical protein
MRASFVVLGLSAMLVGACGGSSEGEPSSAASPTCAAPKAATKADASFRRDVVPLLERSCGSSSCHGSPSSNKGVQLKGDPVALRAGLVSVTASRASMSYVEPGRPEESFLLRKMDGDFCGLAERCKSGCGEAMPKGGSPLPSADRDAVRAWIANGAKDN